jgi:hypothetical protein
MEETQSGEQAKTAKKKRKVAKIKPKRLVMNVS